MRKRKAWIALVVSAAVAGTSLPVSAAELFADGAGTETEEFQWEEASKTEDALFTDGNSAGAKEESGAEELPEESFVFAEHGEIPSGGGISGYIQGEAIVWIEEDASPGNSRARSNALFPYAAETLFDSTVSETSTENLLGSSPEGESQNGGKAVLIKGNGQSTQELIQELLNYPQVKAAEPNYIVTLGSSQPPEDMTAEDAAEIFDDSSAGGEEEPVLSEEEQPVYVPADDAESTFADGEEVFGSESGESAFSDGEAAYRAEAYDDDGTYADMTRGEWNKWNTGQMKGAEGTDVNIDEVWAKYGQGSEKVVVAVVDTGIDYTHPDLAGRMWDEGLNYPALTALGGGPFGINVTSQDVYDSIDPMDDYRHGTHCAGIIAAESNGFGTTGIAPGVELMAVKVMGSSGGSYSDIYRGLQYVLTAARAGVNVKAVNYSLGGPVLSAITNRIMESLGEEGIVTCIASGNDTRDIDQNTMDTSSMQTSPYVVVVDSMDSDGNLAVYSNYGKRYTHVLAPGTSILSTIPTGTEVYTAEYAKGNLLYSGFEDSGDTGSDPAPVGPELEFYQCQEDAPRKMGQKLEPTEENYMLGEKSISLSSSCKYIISAPISIEGVPEGEYHLSLDGHVNNTNLIVGAWLIDKDGEEYALYYSSDEMFYIADNCWKTVPFDIPEEFDSWDDFQICIGVEPYYEGEDLFTAWIDCVGIGRQEIPYKYESGTSMAAPAVAGAAALLSSIYPNEEADVIAAMLRGGAVKSEAYSDLALESGRLDVNKAVENPEPVITFVENLGSTCLLNGFFPGENLTVTIDGIQAEILDQSETYLEVKVPEGFKESLAEITVRTARGTGRFFWLLGDSDRSFQDVELPQGSLGKEFKDITWENVASDGQTLYFLPAPDIEQESLYAYLWTYDTKTEQWGKIPVPGEAMLISIAVCQDYLYGYGEMEIEGLGLTGPTFLRYSLKEGKWEDPMASTMAPRYGSLFEYQGELYCAGGYYEENTDVIFRVDFEEKKEERIELKLPYKAIMTGIRSRGEELLVYPAASSQTNDLYYYDGEDWEVIPFQGEEHLSTYTPLAVAAVEEGFLISGLVKDTEDDGTEWADTWLLRTEGTEPVLEKQDKIFCPSKGTAYTGAVAGDSFYVTAYIPQKGGFILRKLDGVTAYPTETVQNGWQTIEGKTYYYRNGKPVTGFVTIDNAVYYFYQGSSQVRCGATEIGEMVTGWMEQIKSGRRFYFWNGNKKIRCNARQKGAMCTGWVTFSNGSRFFFNNGNKGVKSNTTQKGQMATGWLTGTGGRTFYLWTGSEKVKTNAKKKGQMAVGWVTFADGSRYFMWNKNKNLKSRATNLGERVTGTMYSKSREQYFQFDKNGKLVRSYR